MWRSVGPTRRTPLTWIQRHLPSKLFQLGHPQRIVRGDISDTSVMSSEMLSNSVKMLQLPQWKFSWTIPEGVHRMHFNGTVRWFFRRLNTNFPAALYGELFVSASSQAQCKDQPPKDVSRHTKLNCRGKKGSETKGGGGSSGSLHVLPLPFNSIRSPPPVHQLASSAKHFFAYLHYLVDSKSLGCSLFCAFSSESALTWIVLYCFCVLFSRSPLPSVWFCWLNVSSVVLFVGWLLAGCWLDAERVMADWIHFSGGDLLWLGFQLKLALLLGWPLFDTLQSWWIVVLVGCDSGRVNLLTEQEGAIDPLDWSCKQQQPNGVVDAFLGECSMRTLMNSWPFQGPIDAMNQFEAFHLDSTVWLLASRRFDFRLDSVGPSRLKGTSFPWLQQSTSTVRNWCLNGD